jgi:hypothetical protein
VAAVAILGTVLVGIVLAKARHTRQLARAQRLSAAVRAADELIAAWWTSPAGVPVGAWGVAGTDGSLAWETRQVPNGPIERLGARVVRVEVREAAPRAPGSPAVAQGDSPRRADEPLVAVELVLPSPEVRP